MVEMDDELVVRARDGDDDALSALLEQHSGAVREATRGAIPARWSPLLSEDDVFQESCIRAFLGIATLRLATHAGFHRWLARLAQHALIDALKALAAEKRGGRARLAASGGAGESLGSLLDELSAHCTTPSLRASRNEACAALAAAVDGLPEPYRTVVRDYDLEGRSVDEVAARLERSAGAVFMVRARALSRLRTVLGGAAVAGA